MPATQTHVMPLTYSLLAIHVFAGDKEVPIGIFFFFGGDQNTTAAQKVCELTTHLCELQLHVECVGKTYTLVCSSTAHLRVRV